MYHLGRESGFRSHPVKILHPEAKVGQFVSDYFLGLDFQDIADNHFWNLIFLEAVFMKIDPIFIDGRYCGSLLTWERGLESWKLDSGRTFPLLQGREEICSPFLVMNDDR